MHVIDKLKRNLPSTSMVGGIKSPTSIALKELYEAVLKSGLSSPASELVQECDEWRKEERTPFLGQVSASGSGVQMTMSAGDMSATTLRQMTFFGRQHFSW